MTESRAGQSVVWLASISVLLLPGEFLLLGGSLRRLLLFERGNGVSNLSQESKVCGLKTETRDLLFGWWRRAGWERCLYRMLRNKQLIFYFLKRKYSRIIGKRVQCLSCPLWFLLWRGMEEVGGVSSVPIRWLTHPPVLRVEQYLPRVKAVDTQ